MNIFDNIKAVFSDEEETGGDHDAADHKVENAKELDWKASDFTEDDLVDDEWIKKNTKEVD